MGDPGYPTKIELANLLSIAGLAYDVVHEDIEDTWRRPDDDTIMKIFIAFVRLAGTRP